MKRLDFLKSLIGIPVAAKVITDSTPKALDVEKALRQARETGIIKYHVINSEGSNFEVLPNGNVRLKVPNMPIQDQGRYFQHIDESGIVPTKTIKL